MISLDPEKLMQEILADEKARNEKLYGLEEQVMRYAGPWHSGGPQSDRPADWDPENASFELLSYLVPRLVHGNPRFKVASARGASQRDVAVAIQHALNRWIEDSRFKTTLLDLAVDYGFRWGVAHVTPAPAHGSYEPEDPRLWPQVSRVSPWDFGWDRRAPAYRRSRYTWRRWTIDKEDLLEIAAADEKKPKDEREGWHYSAIEQLPTTSLMEHPFAAFGSSTGIKRRQSFDGPDREELVIYELHIPEIPPEKGDPGPEDGFNGALVTIAGGVGPKGIQHERSSEIRPPRQFFGPRWGPHILIGCYTVPDDPFPLSVLCASANHIEQTNRAAVALDRAISNYAKFVITDDQELASTMQGSKQDGVYVTSLVGELGKHVVQYEKGGASPPMVAAYQMFRDRMNRILGMDEVQRGAVTGEGTATEVKLAFESSLARFAFVDDKWQDGVTRIGQTLAWYLYHTDEISYSLGEDAADDIIEEMGPERAAMLGIRPGHPVFFQGGMFEEGSGGTFEDLGLALEPYSMARQSEASLRQKGEFMLLFATQIAPQIPILAKLGVDVRRLLDTLGESQGVADLASMIDLEQAAAAGDAMLQPERGEPRLTRDLGALPMLGQFAGKGLGGVAPTAAGDSRAATGAGSGGRRQPRREPGPEAFGAGGRQRAARNGMRFAP